MFSVTGAVGELAELLEALVPEAAPLDAGELTWGIIIDFLPLPARRRGLSNR
jgi:hypothetical protein